MVVGRKLVYASLPPGYKVRYGEGIQGTYKFVGESVLVLHSM